MNEVFVMKNIFLLKKQNVKRVIMHSWPREKGISLVTKERD